MAKKHGLLYLLERSAHILEREGEILRFAHTVSGSWPKNYHGARRDYKEMMALAKGLRHAHSYFEPNCLGGPAKIFDAAADRVRAGDDMDEVLADVNMVLNRSGYESEIERLRTIFRLNILRLSPETSHAEIDRILAVGNACRKCGGAMKPGKALAQTWTGTPEFAGDDNCVTLSPGGTGAMIDCLKCEQCGWSVTFGQGERK